MKEIVLICCIVYVRDKSHMVNVGLVVLGRVEIRLSLTFFVF